MTRTAPLDRRHRRREETIEQVLDVAVEVMADQGVAGLTLGEVARRMGIRPPSLYVYFDGKHALYDALFERGWRLLLEEMRGLVAGSGGGSDGGSDGDGDGDGGSDGDLERLVFVHAGVFVRWAVEHPAYAPLMFWRPIPGFVPSERAYAPAVELAAMSRQWLADLRAAGVLAHDADVDLLFRTWTSVISGVVSQQLTNAPGEPYEAGTFTAVLPDVVAMWLAHHGGPRTRS